MIVLGLTGSIGMGKTTAATMFRRLGVPVHDADAETHRLQATGGAALSAIGAAFPGTVTNGSLDRDALRLRVIGDGVAMRVLEEIIHPMVYRAERRFLLTKRRLGHRMAVLDIPLLFETACERRCDLVATVSAPAFVQTQRVLSRPGMTPARLKAILSRQMPDAQKCRRADVVLPTGLGRAVTWRAICALVNDLCNGSKG